MLYPVGCPVEHKVPLVLPHPQKQKVGMWLRNIYVLHMCTSNRFSVLMGPYQLRIPNEKERLGDAFVCTGD